MVCIRLLLVIHCHCKTGSMQVERLQYVPWVEHCGSEVQETERRGSGMAAKAGEPTMNTWMRSDKASCRVFTDSISPFPLYHPNFFLSLSVCFSLLQFVVRGRSLPEESSLWGGLGVIWVSRLEEWPHISGHLSLGRWVVWKREGSLPSRRGVG